MRSLRWSRLNAFSTTRVNRSADLGPVSVANVRGQIPQGAVFEREPAEDVEDLAAQRAALFIEFLEEPLVDLAFAGVFGDEVPEVADLGLADAVDAAETLFEAIGVPGEVVVDHQVAALEVDAFAGGVGGDEDFDLFVLGEGILGLAALLAPQLAVDGHEGLGPPEERSDPLLEVVEVSRCS